MLAVASVMMACQKSSPINGGNNTNNTNGITTPAVLAITDFNPKSGKENTSITIKGTGFGNDRMLVYVAIGNSSYDHPVSVSPTAIVVTTNYGTPTGKISVIVSGNKVFSTDDFTATPDVKVSGYDGSSQLGGQFSLHGSGFGTDISKVTISFGGTTPVKATYLSTSTLTVGAPIPRYAQEGKVTVNVNGITATGDSILKFDFYDLCN